MRRESPTLNPKPTLQVGRRGQHVLRVLSVDGIAKMTPGDEYGDPENKGLRVRCLKDKTKVFFYRYRDKAGALRQVEIGVLGGQKTLTGIRAEFETLKKLVRNGGDPQQEKRKERERASAERQRTKVERAKSLNTCDHLVQSYLSEIVEPNRKAKGAAETRRMLERAIQNYKSLPATDLKRLDAHEMIKAISATAPRVAQMTRAALRACWEHSISVGRTMDNPFLGRTIGAIPKREIRQRVLNKDEVDALLRWMREPNAYSRTVSDALELTLRTGLRSGEVVGMHTRELSYRDGILWLDIPKERMKKNRAHSVPLVGRAAEIVRNRWPEEAGFLFPSRVGDKAIDQKVLGVEVYAASGRSRAKAYAHRRLAPVRDFAPHDLRRTARTLLSELGCPFEVGEAILAHVLPGVAGDYNKAEHHEKRVVWLTGLGEYLDRLVEACPCPSDN